jgi:pyruvate,water dikinase
MEWLMALEYIVKLSDCSSNSPIGNKARSLLFLRDSQCSIPETYICTWEAYKNFLSHPDETKKAVRDALFPIANNNKTFAVRSSSNREDNSQYSYAGLFTTVLNVQGVDAVMNAIETVWQKADSEQVRSYINKTGAQSNDFLMAVIIQEMVTAVFAGVVFTRNPVTGHNETIIEAVKDNGEGLFQSGRTPFRWIIDQDEYVEEPGRNILSRKVIARLVRQSKKISRRYGKPLDLEWCFNGQELYWLQLREITVVQSVNVYTNNFSKEFLPGIIKPLVWSINIPLINGAWIAMLTEMLGPNDLDALRLAKAFYYRAYFNTGVIESIFKQLGFSNKTLHTLFSGDMDRSKKLYYRPGLRSLIFVPRVFLFILDKIRFSRKLDPFLKEMEVKIKGFGTADPARLTEKQLLKKIEGLLKLTAEISYYYLVTPLILYVFTYLLRTLLAQQGFDAEALARVGDAKDLENFDPTMHLHRLHKQFRKLSPVQQEKIKKISYNDFLPLQGIDGFKAEMAGFLERFGHVSDSGNDFSCPPWRETPALILHIVANYENQMNQSTHQDIDILKHVPFFKKWLLHITLKKVQRNRRYKEAVSYLYTYSYGLLRNLFLNMGVLYKQKGYIETTEDIFLLFFDEIKEIAYSGVFSDSHIKAIARRKQEIAQYKNIELPNIIYGDQEPPAGLSKKSSFKGIATSRGYYCGRVKVVNGIKEHIKMHQGDILVIPYSDIGLAPLFAKAGAIISEAGGILSHCSILAREYKIPAITSIDGACSLIDGTIVAVDGYKGEIIVHEQPDIIN